VVAAAPPVYLFFLKPSVGVPRAVRAGAVAAQARAAGRRGDAAWRAAAEHARARYGLALCRPRRRCVGCATRCPSTAAAKGGAARGGPDRGRRAARKAAVRRQRGPRQGLPRTVSGGGPVGDPLSVPLGQPVGGRWRRAPPPTLCLGSGATLPPNGLTRASAFGSRHTPASPSPRAPDVQQRCHGKK